MDWLHRWCSGLRSRKYCCCNRAAMQSVSESHANHGGGSGGHIVITHPQTPSPPRWHSAPRCFHPSMFESVPEVAHRGNRQVSIHSDRQFPCTPIVHRHTSRCCSLPFASHRPRRVQHNRPAYSPFTIKARAGVTTVASLSHVTVSACAGHIAFVAATFTNGWWC